jgi:hypothetical protein
MGRGPVSLVALVLVASVMVPVGAGGTAGATQEQVTLTVAVISQGGAQLGGVTITAAWDGGERTATTANNGRAFVDVPRGANVDITISSDQFVRNFPVTVEDATTREVLVEAARKGSATVQATSPSGSVRGATVQLLQNGRTVVSGETNADGAFETGTIEQGRYTLEIAKRGYYVNRTQVDVGAEGVRHEVEMRTGTVQVEVRVLDDHFDDPRPVSRATVEFGDIGTVRATGGTAVFAVPVNTEHRVRATKQGYESARTQYSVGESAGRVRLTIQREPTVVVRPANQRVVVGESTSLTVVDAYGDPIGNATVNLDGEEVARTDESGQARITIESGGNHTVSASADGIESEGTTIVGVDVDESTPTSSPTATATPTSSPSPTPVPTTTSVSLPGFGPAAAALGVALAALLLARRE